MPFYEPEAVVLVNSDKTTSSATTYWSRKTVLLTAAAFIAGGVVGGFSTSMLQGRNDSSPVTSDSLQSKAAVDLTEKEIEAIEATVLAASAIGYTDKIGEKVDDKIAKLLEKAIKKTKEAKLPAKNKETSLQKRGSPNSGSGATTINFDEAVLPASGASYINGLYQGFFWSPATKIIKPSVVFPLGPTDRKSGAYYNGIVSQSQAIFNYPDTDPICFTIPTGDDFHVLEVYATALWTDGITLSVFTYDDNGDETAEGSKIITTSGPTRINLAPTGPRISSVCFVSSGGLLNTTFRNKFMIDDIKFNQAGN